MSDELFREVDEEVKRDRFQALWKRYGPYAVGAAVAVFLAVAGTILWLDWQEKRQFQFSDRFAAANALAADGQIEAAADQYLSLADDAGTGYGVLSRLRRAALLVELGDTRAAIAIYDEIAQDSRIDREYRDLALVISAMHGLDD
ncbi:MAG: tetratricopeptide repeat protein, partial [Alphaproteobacteria bacterium]